MAYHVLARKWRPRSFAELVGQEPVVTALMNGLDRGRLHHALLFSGTRGVGKTSLARIFAKALNCERGVSSRPCGECRSCNEIDEGRFVDLIEVDAASRTGVDETRELLDNVQYAPARGRFKVYLIDEVHMFSRSSFNALLKTLEEPPEHVKFLLATTEPRRLPVTVLSRCLQFNLRSLPPARIAEHLGQVLRGEDVGYEPAALHRLARAAAGSVRDALSLLDQAIAFSGARVTAADVDTMLGGLDRAVAVDLLRMLAGGDAAALLRSVAELDLRSPDYESLLADMLALLQRVAVVQVSADAVDEQVADPAVLRALAQEISAQDVQLYYQIALLGRRDLPLAPEQRSGFEMVLLRMLAFRSAAAGEPELPRAPAVAEGPSSGAATTTEAAKSQAENAVAVSSPAGARASGATATSPASRALSEALGAVPAAAVTASAAGSETGSAAAAGAEPVPPIEGVAGAEKAALKPVVHVDADSKPLSSLPESLPESLPADGEARAQLWEATCEALRLEGVARALASHCLMTALDEHTITLLLDRACDRLQSASAEARLAEGLTRYFGRPLRLQIELGSPGEETPAARRDRRLAERRSEAEAAIAADPNVSLLRERFGATITPDSVTPTD